MKQPVKKSESDLDVVLSYHEQTKHQLNAYAKGPDTIDWSDQPDAFRHYAGTECIDLPFTLGDLKTKYAELFHGELEAEVFNLASLSGLLELSLGLSAWKQYGIDRWALRCNPSSGNLHPTEATVLLINVTNIDDGIYHYCPDQHQLEKRADIVTDTGSASDPVVLICLSSIHWREAWKYGERAFRYSQLDTGHAMAGLRYAAACYGWRLQTRLDISNRTLDKLFGFNREEDYFGNELESSELLLELHTSSELNNTPVENIKVVNWYGKANQLDDHHFYDWPIINQVDVASQNPGEINTKTEPDILKTSYPPPLTGSTELASNIIKQRRSAQFFDGEASMPESVFWNCLDRTLVRSNSIPFDLLPWHVRIHLAVFVHRVDNIKSGLYLLSRHPDAEQLFKEEFRSELKMDQIETPYEHLSLYKLIQANCQNSARTLFCHQDIASQSAFSIGMLAQFHDTIVDSPWRYRQLFWEAGVIGQALYLEAEANGFRATGVGCYFDDSFHELLGLKTKRLQSLYHFTVGTPIIDQRITSLSGYYHIER